MKGGKDQESIQSGGKDQESIQSGTTPDSGQCNFFVVFYLQTVRHIGDYLPIVLRLTWIINLYAKHPKDLGLQYRPRLDTTKYGI